MLKVGLILWMLFGCNYLLGDKMKTKSAYFAGGCFWGVEYYYEKKDGVVDAVSGYMGGDMQNPDYRSVCTGLTGHFEAVKVDYDPYIVSYEELAKLFFEIHDPQQTDGQGPDIGSQYLSAVFYKTEDEKEVIEKLISILTDKGYKIATKILPYSEFFPAEEYHQNYYSKHKKVPYCHSYTKRF